MSDSFHTIGFLANIFYTNSGMVKLRRHFFDRIITMSEVMLSRGVDLLVYSPINIDFQTGDVEGYVIRDKSFVKKTTKAPKINGDWLVDTSKLFSEMKNQGKLGSREFSKWIETNRIALFVPNHCVQFFRDKKAVQEHVAQISNIKQPRTEHFQKTTDQIDYFLRENKKVFLKPLRGAKSNDIAVISRLDGTINIHLYPTNYYLNGISEHHRCRNLDEALSILEEFAKDKPYIIQQGINVLRYRNAPLHIRILGVNDGAKWNLTNHMSVGKADSDVTNFTSHDGIISYDPVTLLSQMFSPSMAKNVMERVMEVSRLLTDYFAKQFPGLLPEIAYDFVLDEECNIYFLETNTKPGMSYPGRSLCSKMFKILPEEQEIYDQYIIPHATQLAHFFMSKIIT